jgi:hypothetical protein
MSEVTATASSPLGVVSLHVHGSSGVTVGVNEAVAPELPDGMAVDGVMLIQVGITRQVTRGAPLLLDVAVDHEGDAETGEWLESMAFRTAEGVLQVAARDPEWLAGRGIVAEYVDYRSRGFRQAILEAAAGTTVYVSVAWRLGDRTAIADDVSTWFAADLALPR